MKSSKIILINNLTDKATILSKAEVARRLGKSGKTIGDWSVEPVKEYGIWKIYFEPEEVKQNKGFRIRK